MKPIGTATPLISYLNPRLGWESAVATWVIELLVSLAQDSRDDGKVENAGHTATAGSVMEARWLVRGLSGQSS